MMYTVRLTFKTDMTGDRVFPITFYNISASDKTEAEKEAVSKLMTIGLAVPPKDIQVYAEEDY